MKDETEFRGFEESAVMMVKKEGQMKLKTLAKQVRKIFRLSEEFDTDSDASDTDNQAYRGGKKVRKMISKSPLLSVAEDVVTLA